MNIVITNMYEILIDPKKVMRYILSGPYLYLNNTNTSLSHISNFGIACFLFGMNHNVTVHSGFPIIFKR